MPVVSFVAGPGVMSSRTIHPKEKLAAFARTQLSVTLLSAPDPFLLLRLRLLVGLTHSPSFCQIQPTNSFDSS